MVARRSSGYASGFKLITQRSQVRILTPLLKGKKHRSRKAAVFYLIALALWTLARTSSQNLLVDKSFITVRMNLAFRTNNGVDIACTGSGKSATLQGLDRKLWAGPSSPVIRHPPVL